METASSDPENVVNREVRITHLALLIREVGRRLWWSLVCQYAYTASIGGMTYTIMLAHATTHPFANLNDDDLHNGQPRPHGRDMEEMTISSYHLAKVRFALGAFFIVDFALIASGPRLH